MSLVRIYDPNTNEPFDVPKAIADKLRLEEGWLSHEYEEVKAEIGKVVDVVETEITDLIEDVEKIISK